jgi:hypothetical protein
LPCDSHVALPYSGVIDLDELKTLLLHNDTTIPGISHNGAIGSVSGHGNKMSGHFSGTGPLFTAHRSGVDVMDPHRESMSEQAPPGEDSTRAADSVAAPERAPPPDTKELFRSASINQKKKGAARNSSLAERIGFERVMSTGSFKGTSDEDVKHDSVAQKPMSELTHF